MRKLIKEYVEFLNSRLPNESPKFDSDNEAESFVGYIMNKHKCEEPILYTKDQLEDIIYYAFTSVSLYEDCDGYHEPRYKDWFTDYMKYQFKWYADTIEDCRYIKIKNK